MTFDIVFYHEKYYSLNNRHLEALKSIIRDVSASLPYMVLLISSRLAHPHLYVGARPRKKLNFVVFFCFRNNFTMMFGDGVEGFLSISHQ